MPYAPLPRRQIAALSAAHEDGSAVDLEAGLSEEPQFIVMIERALPGVPSAGVVRPRRRIVKAIGREAL